MGNVNSKAVTPGLELLSNLLKLLELQISMPANISTEYIATTVYSSLF